MEWSAKLRQRTLNLMAKSNFSTPKTSPIRPIVITGNIEPHRSLLLRLKIGEPVAWNSFVPSRNLAGGHHWCHVRRAKYWAFSNTIQGIEGALDDGFLASLIKVL